MAAAAAGPITPGGNSVNWNNVKKSAARKWVQFAESNEGQEQGVRGVEFDELSETKLCDKQLWEAFAGWLVHVAKKADNKPLKYGSIKVYFRANLNRVAALHGSTGSAATAEFLKCLDPTAGYAESYKWLNKEIEAIWKACFRVAQESGERMDNTARPFHRSHVEALNRSYAMQVGAGWFTAPCTPPQHAHAQHRALSTERARPLPSPRVSRVLAV